MSGNRRWTAEEDARLRELRKTMPIEAISGILNRTPGAIQDHLRGKHHLPPPPSPENEMRGPVMDAMRKVHAGQEPQKVNDSFQAHIRNNGYAAAFRDMVGLLEESAKAIRERDEIIRKLRSKLSVHEQKEEQESYEAAKKAAQDTRDAIRGSMK